MASDSASPDLSRRGERTARNNVLQSQIGTCAEDIDTDGFHHFSACTYRAAVRRLAEWALPQPHAREEFRETVPTGRWERWTSKKLGSDVRTTEINLLLPTGTASTTRRIGIANTRTGSRCTLSRTAKQLNVASSSASRLEYVIAKRLAQGLGVQV